ncbi:MAG: hypothetical protein ABI681_05160 [Gemmatimonadales bacterium]
MSAFARIYDLTMTLAERSRLGDLRRSVVAPARGAVLEVGAGVPRYGF